MWKLYWWQKLGQGSRNADGVRDHKVAAERHKAEIELARLRSELRYLEERDAFLNDEIRLIGKPEAWARHRAGEGKIWLMLFILSLIVTVGATLWALQYADLGWAKQLIIAVGVLAIPIAATEIFMGSLKELTGDQEFRKTLIVISLIALLGGLVATGLLAASRGLATNLAAGSSQIEDFQVDGRQDLTVRAQRLDRIKRNIVIIDISMAITIICLAIAGDLVLGLSFFMARQNLGPARTVLRLHKDLTKVRRDLVKNNEDQEAARRRPEIVYEELTAGALYMEAKNDQRVPAEIKSEIPAAKYKVSEIGKNPSIWSLMKKTALVVFTAIGLVAALMVWAMAADTIVVGVDLTTSNQTHHEFPENLRTVEDIIQKLNVGDHLMILGIESASFGSEALLDEVMPDKPGRFGERLEGWRARILRNWRTRSRTLKPRETGSDLFGFFNRAAVIFSDNPNTAKKLVVLSDMRHVGQGINFEKAEGLARIQIIDIKARGLIPNLQGAKIWILGVHTNGISAIHWRKLNDFWTDYLGQASAQLVVYGPGRRLIEKMK